MSRLLVSSQLHVLSSKASKAHIKVCVFCTKKNVFLSSDARSAKSGIAIVSRPSVRLSARL